MLRFYFRTTFNLLVGMTVAFGIFVGLRAVLWLFGRVPFVLLVSRLPSVFGMILVAALLGSAIWTGAQWLQRRSFD